jgi:hypothetical protein
MYPHPPSAGALPVSAPRARACTHTHTRQYSLATYTRTCAPRGAGALHTPTLGSTVSPHIPAHVPLAAQVLFKYVLPLSEVVTDFYDELKVRSAHARVLA